MRAAASMSRMNHKTFKASDAHKLDDPERLCWMPPDEVVGMLRIAPGMVVADIGAGTGFFALPFARAVSPTGKVWAVDLQSEMLQLIQQKLDPEPTPLGVTLILGTAKATCLPGASCDVAFLGNVWHELDHLDEVLGEVQRILRPGGRLAILDWRHDVVSPPGPPLDHRISARETEAAVANRGWYDTQSSQLGRHSYLVIAHPPLTL